MLLKTNMAKGVFKRLEKMQLQWNCDEHTAEYHVSYSNEIKLKGLYPASVHLYALRNDTNNRMFAFVLVRNRTGRILPISEFYYDNSANRTSRIDISRIFFDMLHGTDHRNVSY